MASTFKLRKKLSATALSQQLPSRDILWVMLQSLASCLYDSEVYCTPRSECSNKPGEGLRLEMARCSAKQTRLALIFALVAHPTTMRLKRSTTTAKYSQPSSVQMYVMSDTHLVFGTSTVNLRAQVIIGYWIVMVRVSCSNKLLRCPLAFNPYLPH